MVAITPTFCAAYTLRVHCFHCLILCCHLSTPLLSVLLLFFKWDNSVNGVEPPPALDLHLVLSVSFFQRSCVSPKLSVIGRLFQLVRALATCRPTLFIVGWLLALEYCTLCT